MVSRCFPILCAALLLSGSSWAQQWGPWQGVGPFEHLLGHANLDERHPPEGGLSEMKLGRPGPKLGMVFRGEGRVDARWHEVKGGSTSFDVGQIHFKDCLPAVPGKANWPDYSAAYLYRKAVMGVDRDVRVHMGCDDGMKVWLNGAVVFERTGGRGVNLYDEALLLPMREGVNHLLIKVVNGEGGWGFQMGPWRRLNQIGISKAMERGVQYFLDRQLIDGSFGTYRHIEPGGTAFILYTLLKCGVRPGHPVIQRARARILAYQNDATYPTATKILALAEMNEEGDKGRIAKLIKIMEESQMPDGLFQYSDGGYNGQHLRGDLSNALFAALAYRAASKVGVSVKPSQWSDLARGALACWQTSDGLPRTGGSAEPRGFGYTPGRAPTSSMTVAGVSMLAIVDEGAGSRVSGKLRNPIQMGMRGGLAWLEEHFSWTTNVGHSGGHHNFFSIYGMERVGGLLDTPVVANRDWYYEGSQQLLKWQRSNGTWAESGGHSETELALLFLSRATARISGKGTSKAHSSWTTEDDPGAAVALRGSGDTPAIMWMEGVHKDLLAGLEWDGQDGQGPHVSRVDYFARRDVPSAKFERIERIAGDPSQPVQAERFAIRHRFPANGVWLVHARVMCVKESEAGGVLGEEAELLSGELELIIRDVVTEEQLAYAEDSKNNLLRTIEWSTSNSTQIKGEESYRAFDGNFGTRWHCLTNDKNPRLVLNLGRPIRGRKIVLTHAWPSPKYEDTPRPLRGELIINGHETVQWEMDPHPMTKTVIDLGRSHRIRTLDIRIKQALFGRLGECAVGFSEVEVYR